jgi:hypothetical protein
VRVRALRRSASATCVYSLCIYSHMEVYMEKIKEVEVIVDQETGQETITIIREES